MANPRRIQIPNLLYHVMSRGNRRMTIFLDDLDYRQFIQMLRQTVERFALECSNYCAMPNHYHAAIRPSQPNLSAAMQYLNGRYALWWNRRHKTVGHLFQGRFKSQVVQDDAYARSLARYIALNPVRAGLVKRPEDWRWSAYASTIGRSATPSFLAADATLALFGDGDRHTLGSRFTRFVVAGCGDDMDDDRIRSSDLVLGDSHFTVGTERPADASTSMVLVAETGAMPAVPQ
jgi:REP element-mobilizing transposase RayT